MKFPKILILYGVITLIYIAITLLQVQAINFQKKQADDQRKLLAEVIYQPDFIATSSTPITREAVSGKPAASTISPKIILGQNFVTGVYGYDFDDSMKNYLEVIKPSGIVIYDRNIKNDNQLKKLISDLQSWAKEATGQPLFIMIDEEPGGASRLGLFKNMFGVITPGWEQMENDIKKMADIGINVDLAPIMDYPFNGESFIKKRILKNDLEDFEKFNDKFVDTLKKNCVYATLKHFPGLGVFADNPHSNHLNDDIDNDTFDKSVSLFKNGFDSGADFIMTNTAVYKNIDPDNPVIISKAIVTDLLRNKLNYKGMVITDDISNMPFAGNQNLPQAISKALMAGHNLILFSHENVKLVQIYKNLLSRMEENPELKTVIENNYRDITSFKREKLMCHQ
ncbi:MAG: hypothetical protein MUD10_02870 [Candidatus Pacebacteria bacterium]|nr:hypothetical protein [Candidatus Paceibacterota bacterium]